MPKIVVTGSIAYDYVMQVDNEFKNIILPDHLHKLNVGFLATGMQQSLGGTATNIAYSLGLLGMKDDTVMLGAVGKEFVVDEKLSKYVDFDHILKVDDDFTACAYVITDSQQNQIIPFYPGAMNQAHTQSLSDLDNVEYCIVSPNATTAMIKFIQEAKAQNINCFFDPGQQLPAFTKEELIACCVSANYLICNEYEFNLLMKITEWDQEMLLKYFEKIIVTMGAHGVMLLEEGRELTIPGILVIDAVDPTGCGDALRSGLLYGLANGKSREESLRIGNIVASYVVKQQGTVNHFFTWTNIKKLLT